MLGEATNAERPVVPGVQEEGPGGAPRPQQPHRQGRVLLRPVQEDLRDPLHGADATLDPIVRQLKQLHEESGWSQDQTAQRAGMRKQQLNAVFTGATKSPGVAVLHRIARALGYDLELRLS